MKLPCLFCGSEEGQHFVYLDDAMSVGCDQCDERKSVADIRNRLGRIAEWHAMLERLETFAAPMAVATAIPDAEPDWTYVRLRLDTDGSPVVDRAEGMLGLKFDRKYWAPFGYNRLYHISGLEYVFELRTADRVDVKELAARPNVVSAGKWSHSKYSSAGTAVTEPPEAEKTWTYVRVELAVVDGLTIIDRVESMLNPLRFDRSYGQYGYKVTGRREVSGQQLHTYELRTIDRVDVSSLTGLACVTSVGNQSLAGKDVNIKPADTLKPVTGLKILPPKDETKWSYVRFRSGWNISDIVAAVGATTWDLQYDGVGSRRLPNGIYEFRTADVLLNAYDGMKSNPDIVEVAFRDGFTLYRDGDSIKERKEPDKTEKWTYIRFKPSGRVLTLAEYAAMVGAKACDIGYNGCGYKLLADNVFEIRTGESLRCVSDSMRQNTDIVEVIYSDGSALYREGGRVCARAKP